MTPRSASFDGLVKVVDFGLAKFLGQTGLTRPGTALGTVSWQEDSADLWVMDVTR